MKTIIVYIILAIFSHFSAKAQNQYETEMTKGFELWSAEQAGEAANHFERIANAEKENWLPYYYASQVKIVQSFPMADVAKKEQLLDEAQKLLDRSKELGGEEVELMVLQAMLHTARLTVNPSIYGMKLSPVINGIYSEALSKAPENPRVKLSKAEWDMGSASFFGKDPKIFCPDLQASLELFSKETHSKLTAPAWGEDRAKMLIAEQCIK